MDRDVMWVPRSTPGLEHLRLVPQPDGGTLADSLVIGISDGGPFRARYQVRCDAAWRARHVRVELLGAAQPRQDLHADGAGAWTDGDGNALPLLDGCIDVDLTVTPYTNTLPIRRLTLAPGQSVDLRVAYIEVPELRLSVRPQRYTCLEADPNGGLYRFTSPDGNFTANLAVDADGLVLDYPELFRLIWSG